MRHESECHCPPTDVDIWVVVLSFGVLGDTSDRVDAVEKRCELHRAADRAVPSHPSAEILYRGVYFVVGQDSHDFDRIPSGRMSTRIVVAGALIVDGKLLVAQRNRPPELAGLWELPGGKVADGESDGDALARELREELGVEVSVGERLGVDVSLGAGLSLRAYRVALTAGELHPHDHRALRWVTRDDLTELPWVPADTAWLPDLAAALQCGLLRQPSDGAT